MISSLIGAKLGATIAGVAVGLGGTALAVAYAGSHPSENPDTHTVISAPAATTTPHPSATKTKNGVGPDATGPAAFGLCNAWSHHQANGAKTHGNAKNSVAFRNLAAAAGGEQKIASYCAKIPHPTGTADPDEPGDKPTTHPTGKPSAHPTGAATTHPTGATTTHPTGAATTQSPDTSTTTAAAGSEGDA
jgi:hypothetical protein